MIDQLFAKLSRYPGQFLEALALHVNAYNFLRNKQNKIWKGLKNYGSLFYISIALAVVVSYKYMQQYIRWFQKKTESAIDQTVAEAGFMTEAGSAAQDFAVNGTTKYMLLIFLEIIIFHLIMRTYSVLTDKDLVPTIKDFIRAEIRMIKVVLRSMIFEFIIGLGIKVVFGIFLPPFIVTTAVFLVSCYYIGFTFLDNYTELFRTTIKESAKIIEFHGGAAIAIGLVAFLVLKIPLIGLLVAPMMGAVVATFYMSKNSVELGEITFTEKNQMQDDQQTASLV